MTTASNARQSVSGLDHTTASASMPCTSRAAGSRRSPYERSGMRSKVASATRGLVRSGTLFVPAIALLPTGDVRVGGLWAVESRWVIRIGHEHRRVEHERKSTRLNSSHVAISYAVFC